MKIKVSVTDKGHTSVIVDGVELNMLAEGLYTFAKRRRNPGAYTQSSDYRRSRH